MIMKNFFKTLTLWCVLTFVHSDTPDNDDSRPLPTLPTPSGSVRPFQNNTGINAYCRSTRYKYKYIQHGAPALFYCNVGTEINVILSGWILNGKVIRRSNNSRIQVDSTYINDKYREDSIWFSPILSRDAGKLEYFLVFLPNGVWNHTFNLTVIPPPDIAITPLFGSLPVSANFSITCYITNYDTCCTGRDTTIDWYKDNIAIDIIGDISQSQYSMSTLYLHNVKESDAGVYTCRIDNGPMSYNASMVLDVFTKDIIPCKEENDESDNHWPTTAPGLTQLLPCPSGYTGNIKRKCSLQDDGSGKWEEPNNIDCVRTEINAVEDMIQDIAIGIGNPEIVIKSALDQLYTATNTSELTSGDIVKTNDLLYTIINTDKDSVISALDQEKFYGTLDNTLSERNIKQWNEINDNSDRRSGSFVLDLVSKSGAVLGRQLKLGNTLTKRKKNFVVQIKKSSSDSDIIFPAGNDMTGEPVDANIYFPKENIKSQNGNVISTSAVFKTVSSFLPKNHQNRYGNTSVESVILALSLDIATEPVLERNVTMHFNTTQNNITDPEISCAFWNFSLAGGEGWSTEGCRLLKSSKSTAYCECNHLTNFAILMSPSETPEEHVKALEIISIIGCSISILGLLLTAGVYIFLWRYVKSGRSVLLVNLCFTLAVANLVFLSAVDKVENEALCIFITALLHYLYLVVFFIMFAKGVLIFMAVKVVFKTQSKIKLLLFFVWGVPAVIVAVTVGVSFSKEYHSENYCWLTLSNGVLYSFIAPVVVIIIANLIIIMVVLHVIYTSNSVKDKSRNKKAKTGLRSMCTLLPILGVTWAFGVLSINEDLIVFQYLFAITNSLQGMFIFIFHCFFSPQVRNALRNRMRRYEVKTMYSGTNDQKVHSTQSFSA